MSEPLLRIEDMEKRHETFHLSIPEFTIERGRSYAVTGPNGAGKTTLLRIMAMLDEPDAGALFFRNARIWPSDQSVITRYRRQTTMLTQNPYLFRTSVFHNVGYGLKIRGVASNQIEKQALQALQAVGLKDFAGRPARRLSTGEAQRVSLARALAVEPQLLLLDEPTASADRESVPLIEQVIGRLREEKKTAIVFSTHHIDQAYRNADDVFSLRDGRMIRGGPANLFSAVVEETDEGQVARINNGTALEVATDRRGSVYVQISPDEILISKQPVISSARNVIRGKITAVVMEGTALRLTVEGPITLSARITGKSYEGLGLTVGDAVFATFKVSAARVL